MDAGWAKGSNGELPVDDESEDLGVGTLRRRANLASGSGDRMVAFTSACRGSTSLSIVPPKFLTNCAIVSCEVNGMGCSLKYGTIFSLGVLAQDGICPLSLR